MSKVNSDLPKVIGTRTSGMEPLLKRWRERNPHTPWAVLIDRCLRRDPELRSLAGKRYAHLVEGAR